MINNMGIDVRNLLKSAYEIAYFSRGGVDYHQVLRMTPLERDLAVDFINKRLEAAAKMPFPIF